MLLHVHADRWHLAVSLFRLDAGILILRRTIAKLMDNARTHEGNYNGFHYHFHAYNLE
jgi:hypothetical protein